MSTAEQDLMPHPLALSVAATHRGTEAVRRHAPRDVSESGLRQRQSVGLALLLRLVRRRVDGLSVRVVVIVGGSQEDKPPVDCPVAARRIALGCPFRSERRRDCRITWPFGQRVQINMPRRQRRGYAHIRIVTTRPLHSHVLRSSREGRIDWPDVPDRRWRGNQG